MRHRVIIERPERTYDGAGGAVISWQTVSGAWAAMTARGGGEAFDSGRTSGRVSYEFTMRFRDDVLPEHRIRFGTRVFEISATFDADGRRRWLTCVAEERDL